MLMTVLDVIHELFGEELGPDLIARIPSLPDGVLPAFAERYFEFLGYDPIPAKGDGELRPFLTYDGLSVARAKFRLGVKPHHYFMPSSRNTAALAEDGLK